MFLQYLKKIRFVLLWSLLCAGIFFLIFVLEEINLRAAAYPTILCLAFGLLFLLCGYLQYKRTGQKLEHLLQGEIHSVLRCGEVVARVVEQCRTHTEVECAAGLTVEEFGALYFAGYNVIDGDGGTHEKAVGGAQKPTHLHLRLPAFHVATVGIVVAHVVAHAPELAGEGVEIDGVVDALAVVGEDVCAAHTEHVEAHGTDIAEERHVARRLYGVVGVVTVESGGDETYAELGVGAVMRAADDAEVETSVLLLLVGIVEVVEETCDYAALLRLLQCVGSLLRLHCERGEKEGKG